MVRVRRIVRWAALTALAGAAYTTAATSRPAFSDARSAVMGTGGVAEAGFFALTTNPAALTELPAWQFPFTHRIYAAPDTLGETFGGAFPLGSYGTLAGGFTTTRTGAVEVYDPYGRYGGTYVYHDDSLACGYGVKAAPWMALGGAFHYDRHVTAPDDSYGNRGLDAGVFFRPFSGQPSQEYTIGIVTAGLAARDILASELETYAGTYRDPTMFTAGASWSREIGSANLTLAGASPLPPSSDVTLGCELLIASYFAGRAGVTGRHPAVGFGVCSDLFSFDYAYTTRELGSNHYLTVSINPGRDVKARSSRRREIQKLTEEGRALFESGKYERAVERLGKVLEWDPHNEVARQYWVLARYYQYLTEGERLLRDKQWDLARRAFRGALVVVPDDFVAKEYLLRVDEMEKRELERQAEEERVREKLTEAKDLVKRASYRKAIDIYQDILKNHPERDDVKKLLAEARRLLAAATKQPDVAVTPTAIPAEAVERYRAGSAAHARGAVGDSIHTLEQLLLDYPTYGDARAKLVDAYTYQGLDFYSKGSLSAALRSWRRALSYDPGNVKIQRYIKKAETEIDQIR